jgi:hypothetical protein
LGSKREVLIGKCSFSKGYTCLSLGVCQSMILFCLLAKRSISSSWRCLISDLS